MRDERSSIHTEKVRFLKARLFINQQKLQTRLEIHFLFFIEKTCIFDCLRNFMKENALNT